VKEAVFAQIFFFLRSILFGGLVLFLYDAIRILRRIVRHSSMMICAEDFLYWILIAGLSFEVLYYYNWGELRGFFFVAVLAGMVFYYLKISPIIMRWAWRVIQKERQIGQPKKEKLKLFFVRIVRNCRNGLKDTEKEVKITFNRKNKRGESNQKKVQKKWKKH
jgi:spore cortex biosynthesis protein YabQ